VIIINDDRPAENNPPPDVVDGTVPQTNEEPTLSVLNLVIENHRLSDQEEEERGDGSEGSGDEERRRRK
jgi:hypothetical protein